MRSDFGGDILELGGLVTEHDEIRAPRDLGVAGERLPPDLRRQRLRALGQRVRAHHGTTPTARECAGHVA